MLAPVLPSYPPRGKVERALDLLFPPICVGCRRPGRWICLRCWPLVSWLSPNQDDTLPAAPTLDRILGVAMFEGLAREAVHALKYEGHHAISSLMGKLMADQVRAAEADVVIPLALHPSRRRERGYDQAALLARHMASAAGLPYRTDVLRRIRKTQQQATLSTPRERRENVRGAFAARTQLDGETVLLVDDVFTTGATMDEAALALKDAGAAHVVGVVFARAD